jgi:hypothetical protein
MPAPPCHQINHVGVGDLGQQPLFAEILNQARQVAFRGIGTGMMSANSLPVSIRHMVNLERDRCNSLCSDEISRLLVPKNR